MKDKYTDWPLTKHCYYLMWLYWKAEVVVHGDSWMSKAQCFLLGYNCEAINWGKFSSVFVTRTYVTQIQEY